MTGESVTIDGAIYYGWVWHHRYQPVEHKFRYRVFMMYLDLAKVDSVFNRSLLWGRRWFHLARFKRSDYFSINGNCDQTIESAVRQQVKHDLGRELTGSICVLTNLRYFGYITNPISCYYCFNEDSTNLEALLIEVTNTPWGEKHHYVLDLHSYGHNEVVQFEKKMHVSPFMPMNRMYRWNGSVPSRTLRYSLASMIKSTVPESTPKSGKNGNTGRLPAAELAEAELQFDSGVVFKEIPVSGFQLNKVLLTYPLMTIKVIVSIYWQALLLWLKKVPFVSHPNKSPV